MPSVPTTTSPGVSTGTIASSRIVVSMQDEIQQLDPVRRPLLFLLSLLGTVDVPGPVDQWQEEDRAQITTGVNGATIFDGLPAGSTATVTVDEASIYKINHTVHALVNGGDAGTFNARVTAVDETANQIIISALATLPGLNINDNAVLVIVGSAYEEFSSRPVAMAVQPSLQYNYIQHFRDTWAATDYMMATDVYGEPEFQRLANRATLRQLQDIENALWWGVRYVPSAGDGLTHEGRRSTATQPRWFTGGVFWRISTNVTLSNTNLGALTYSDFLTYLQSIAQYNPGETFSGFFGPDFISRVNAPAFMVGATNGPVNHNRDLLDQSFGFNIKKLETPHGDVVLFPSYDTFHQRTAVAGSGTNSLDIKGAVLYMRKMRLTSLPGKGIGTIEMNIQNPGDHGRMDGIYSYVGLRMPNEQHHMEMHFLSNTVV